MTFPFLPETPRKSPEELADLTRLVALVIEKMLVNPCGTVTTIFNFNPENPPKCAISDFLNRHVLFLQLREEHLIAILVYLYRHMEYQPELRISSSNIHRLLAAIIVAAHKFFNGQVSPIRANNGSLQLLRMCDYASISEIPLNQMMALEVALLNNIRFHLYISNEVYLEYKYILASYANTPNYFPSGTRPVLYKLIPDEVKMLANLKLQGLQEEFVSKVVITDDRLKALERLESNSSAEDKHRGRSNSRIRFKIGFFKQQEDDRSSCRANSPIIHKVLK